MHKAGVKESLEFPFLNLLHQLKRNLLLWADFTVDKTDRGILKENVFQGSGSKPISKSGKSLLKAHCLTGQQAKQVESF